MQRISAYQFVSLLILFQVGSYVIFGYATSAKQDAWLVALLSSFGGLGLVWLYVAIYRQYPGCDWVQILEHTLGKWLGKAFASLYVITFVYSAGRVLRDFGELATTFILPHTPILVVMISLLFVSLFGLQNGFESVARTAEFILVLFCLLVLIYFAFLLASDVTDFEFMLPIAHKKRAILSNFIPLGITVPFGEAIAFMMFYYQVKQQKLLGILLAGSVLGTGIVLAFLNLLAIASLGPDVYARNIYPLLTAIQLVAIADFLENVDALMIVYIGVAAFFKITVFLYSASLGTASLCGLQEYRTAVIPMTITLLFLSYYAAGNLSEHVFIGFHWVTWVCFVPLFIILPVLVWLIALIRNRGGSGHVEAQEV